MNTSKKLLFCKFKPQEFEKILSLLCSLFKTTPETVKILYQEMNRTFDEPNWPMHFTDRSFFESLDSTFQEIYQKSPVVATDLPSLLEWDDGNENKSTITVIAQDPKQGQDHEKLVIGTPFGLHHKDSRETLKYNKYFDLIQDLLNLGHRVYLTDIWKIWVCDPENSYKTKTLPKVDQQRFLQLLKPELEAVKSIGIITWGKPANNAIKALNLDIKHLEFPHPSGACNGTWKKLIGSATAEDKRTYWQKIITQELG